MGSLMQVWVGHGESGRLVDPQSATISVFDHGFTVADGVFETMQLQHGRVFLWPWHLERLRHSALTMGLMLPSEAHLTDVVQAVAQSAEALGRGRLRLTITGGDGPLGSDRTSAQPTVVAAAAATKAWPDTAQLWISTWPRNERNPLTHVKTTSYADNVLALAKAHEHGCSEAVFLNTAGKLTEGTGSNVFIVSGGTALTPPVADGLLAGVTRRFVMGLTDAGMAIEERSMSRAELEAADEVFITSSTRDIQPVDRIGDHGMVVGPITRELQRRFRLESERNEYWL